MSDSDLIDDARIPLLGGHRKLLPFGKNQASRRSKRTAPTNSMAMGVSPQVSDVETYARTVPARPKQPMRTTKNNQKLVVFPPDAEAPIGITGISPVLPSFTGQGVLLEHIPDALDQNRQFHFNAPGLRRVTAYCSCTSFKMDALIEDLRRRQRTNFTLPQKFDEVIYTPYASTRTEFWQSHQFPSASSNFNQRVRAKDGPTSLDEDTIGHPTHYRTTSAQQIIAADEDIARMRESSSQPGSHTFENPLIAAPSELAAAVASDLPVGEIFYFDYGVVVFWGFDYEDEQTLLHGLIPFAIEPLPMAEMEVEDFRFTHDPERPPRIFNDVISLRTGHYMAKMTISHAMAQSVKLTHFEQLINDTIESTEHIPRSMAVTGTVNMTRAAITRKIGQLFTMRINVNLVSNVLDTPEIFWSEPSLEPLYRAVRAYLEITQRIAVLNQRCSVISDLLDMLREHLNSSHGETLELIVIALIGFEVIIGIMTICVDVLYKK